MILIPLGADFERKIYELTHRFVYMSDKVDAAYWQSVSIAARPEMQPHELLNVSLEHPISASVEGLMADIRPNLPWAEDHFKERVSGEPMNPPPSASYWPFARRDNAEFKTEELFSHTYPERMWPKRAGHMGQTLDYERMGIRFPIGDLGDVVKQLHDDPLGRQAYLPIWFPEDTGGAQGNRVPCTLGYHFIIRDGKLHCIYYIRSCDFLRHFRDDVYMAMRLVQWMCREVDLGIGPGNLTMHITSFHVFDGDMPRLRRELETNSG